MTDDMLIGVWALSAYLYNTSGAQYARDVYGDDCHESYLAEKAAMYADCPQRALAALDIEHFCRLAKIATDTHATHARRMFDIPS